MDKLAHKKLAPVRFTDKANVSNAKGMKVVKRPEDYYKNLHKERA